GQIGSVAATYAIEHHGTQKHTYTKEEFAQRYKDGFGDSCPLE
ncbi:MAG: carbohydrate kinase family protein, partial [Candidatus Magasanikbacteria bacterium]|nr:carbohydrate kinase family protein [Candidatus Magasanikbacteria bacterium]